MVLGGLRWFGVVWGGLERNGVKWRERKLKGVDLVAVIAAVIARWRGSRRLAIVLQFHGEDK